MKTFVFLHGTFQGGWAWSRTARALRAIGCEAYTPTFTGSGERRHLAVPDDALATYLADIENLFFHEDIPRAVLVCHGFSGMIAPILAQRLGSRVMGLVFLEAAVPEPGLSFMDLAPPPLAGLLRERTLGDGQVGPFRSALFRALELDHGHRERLSRFPARALGEPYNGPNPAYWPQSVFVGCGGDQDPFALAMLKRARNAGLETHCRDMRSVPVLGRCGEIARLLKDLPWRQPIAPATAEGCGNPRMPEKMRMLYCPHYRKRMQQARKGR